ncbi:MAG: YkgJ family cysteine cluster protein [Acidobacteria bacterium]|nr:MAG: YkgJ family cysteine cluster protein [Acidobacteriota bacterium]
MRLQVLDRALLREVDRRLQEGSRKAGKSLACRPGCTACCIGVFTINLLDAWRLRQGLEHLELADPAQAQAVRQRSAHVVRLVREEFPGDARTGLLDPDEERIDSFTQKFSNVACPALDPATGLCALYSHRPMSCRTFGLPVLEGDEKLSPCSLCFQGSSSKEIEDCRVEPDPDGFESAILSELPEIEADGDRETLVAYALIPDVHVRLASDDRTDESRAGR